jgi:AraC-like DNA-binding protein
LKEYLDNHLSERLNLEKCGEITFLSVSQTIRSFRNAYGVTPYEYLNQRRINTAKLLLRNSTLGIEEIAVQTGFPDHNYFSKYFKKKVGVSPSRFRKQQ